MSGAAFRLAEGGRVDRGATLGFSFDGRTYAGLRGDTLASALLANGVHLMGRSFKYHRPRGVLGAGVDEPNALVEVDRGPGRRDANLPATTVELFDGLVARSQNRWPSLAVDVGEVNNLASPLIPAGFYYKTFLWPRRAWAAFYEPTIRRAAGLGRAPDAEDPDRYALRYEHCETLVVGAGPAGLAAALAASEGHGRVILCDEQAEPGGSLLSDPAAVIDGAPGWTWLAGRLAELARRPNVTILPRTTAFLYAAQNMVGLAERLADHRGDAAPGALRQRWRQVRAAQVVLAAGAHERPLVFPGNDRPGVMLASAARIWLNRYGVVAGRRVVVAVQEDSGYQAAFDLARAGSSVIVAEARRGAPPALAAEAGGLGVAVLADTVPVGTSGRLRVRGVRLRGGAGDERHLVCDLLLMAGGWTPAVHLFSQARGRIAWDAAAGAYLPAEASQAVRCAGACRGVFDLAAALRDGWLAGGATAVGSGVRGGAPLAEAAAVSVAAAAVAVASPLPARDVARGGVMAFVDFQNDVTAKDIALAVREGFRSVEHIKRYTTTGMATDQGRTSNVNAMQVAGAAMGKATAEVGVTTFRAPYTPTAFGMLTGYNRGALFDPARTTPMHGRAVAAGAVFEDVGLWKRARYFPLPGEAMEAAVRRECRRTRQAAGIFDASTLGKIEVVGPDAAEFMNRMYVNAWTRLQPGRCRYGVMLREDGFIYDDGVVGRLAQDRFHVTTTTGNAAGVLNLMEDYLQTEFTDLRVWLTSTTEQWAVIAVQGPRARDILAPLVDGIDLSKAAFPHMAVRLGHICGIPVRLFRMSFTGELGFEVNVPAGHGDAVWQAMTERGAQFGAVMYGTEAMHVMRAEKGFIIVGQDTDGTVTPDDAGLGWAVGKGKRDFVGQRSLARPDMHRADRKQLVGLRPRDGGTIVEEGAQIVPGPDAKPYSAEGHVTSSYWSDACGGPIALALLNGGRARMGETVHVTLPGTGTVPCEVTGPVFHDPQGQLLDV